MLQARGLTFDEAIRALQTLRAHDERAYGPVGLRQFGIPLGWLWKDCTVLIYISASTLAECDDAAARTKALTAAPVTDDAVRQLAALLEVKLLFLRRDQVDPSLLSSERVLFQNAGHVIVSAR